MQKLSYVDAGVEGVRRRGFATAVVGVLIAGAVAPKVHAQIASADTAAMNFALNLQYLCGQYFCLGLFGNTLDPIQTRGFGLGGVLAGRVIGGRRVPLPDRGTELPMLEIGFDTFNNINVLRGILRGDLVAQPELDISTAPFTAFLRNAGAIGLGETFDAFASPDNFVLGAYLINDTMMTAYRGLVPTITDPIVLATMSGLLSTRAAHAATIRQLLYRRAQVLPALLAQADLISNQRDRLDGAQDLDEGISPGSVAGQSVANISASDSNGEAFSRTPQQVLNILYGTASAASRGGFFPVGVAGSITTSVAS